MKSKFKAWLKVLEAHAKQMDVRRRMPQLFVRFGEIFPLQEKRPAPPLAPSAYPPSIEIRFVQPRAQEDSSKTRPRDIARRRTKKENTR